MRLYDDEGAFSVNQRSRERYMGSAANSEPESLELEGRRIAVVASADLARSPRMVSHALSLAEAGADVDLIGRLDDERGDVERYLPVALQDHPRISIHPLGYRELRTLSVVALGLASIWRAFSLSRQLRRLPKLDLVLVQNPPTLPSLPCVRRFCQKRKIPWIIDWHNTSYHVLMQKLGGRGLAVKHLRRIEGFNGSRATAHLAVSRGFGEFLADQTGGGVLAWSFYDRPKQPSLVTPSSSLRRPLGTKWRSDGRAVVVSSCSWTQEDNLPMLFRALDLYRERFEEDGLRPLRVVLTGRGPMRGRYDDRIAGFSSGPVVVEAGWLEADKYLELLCCADLGVSVHDSASGIDLPIKIVDLFTAGVPVAAYDYGPVLTELVEPERNGRLFKSAEELGDLLVSLLDPRSGELAALKRGVKEELEDDWANHWSATVLPLVHRLIDDPEPQLRLATDEIHLGKLEDDFQVAPLDEGWQLKPDL